MDAYVCISFLRSTNWVSKSWPDLKIQAESHNLCILPFNRRDIGNIATKQITNIIRIFWLARKQEKIFLLNPVLMSHTAVLTVAARLQQPLLWLLFRQMWRRFPSPSFYCALLMQPSRNGIATGYGLDGRNLIPGSAMNLLFCIASRPALEPTLSSIQWLPGTISSAVKRQRRVADHSLTSI
jgi:hypothetical protein